MIKKTISESAFLVNESRSKNVKLSQDIYSHLWTTKISKKLFDDFKKNVYPYDDIEMALRNRFFLEQLNKYINKYTNPFFVNIASGFTSYPFLVSKPCRCIEIDIEHVIKYKEKKINNWIKNNVLPECDITYIATDLCDTMELQKLRNFASSVIQYSPSFFLLEGISYFSEFKNLNQIIDMIRDIQIKDSLLCFDFWDLSDKNHLVFKKLREFFEERFNFKNTQYNLINIEYIQNINDYKISESTDIQRLEKKYSKTNYLDDYKKILPESYVVLKKQ